MSEDPIDLLSAIFPNEQRAELARVLAASSNNLERATNALICRGDAGPRPSKRKKTGLDSWLGNAGKDAAGGPSSSASFFKAGTTRKDDREQVNALKSAFDLLAQGEASNRSSEPAPTPALPPLTLSTPEQVAQATNGLCTLIFNVLPKELAARLFLKMKKDSEGGPDGKGACELETARVESCTELMGDVSQGKRTSGSCLIGRLRAHIPLRSMSTARPRTGATIRVASRRSVAWFSSRPWLVPNSLETIKAAQYWYNGEKRPAQIFSTEADEAREVIGPLVRSVLAARPVRFLPLARLSTLIFNMGSHRNILSSMMETGLQTSPLRTSTPARRRCVPLTLPLSLLTS